MVRRVLTLVYQEIRGLHQAAYILAFFTFGSQLLALVRDRLLASQFGAGGELDLYYAAFRIPDLLFVLFASTLSVYVLLPFVNEYISQEKATEARQFLSEIFSLFLLLYSAVAVVIWVLAPYIVPVVFPGLIESQTTVVALLRILLLQPLLLGVSSLFGVITQLNSRFVLYALSPILYNVGIIFGVVVLYPLLGLTGLVWGVVLGALLHLLVQVPLVRQSALAFGVTLKLSWSTIWRVLSVSIPRAFTLSLGQLVLLALVGAASVMSVGSVSVFQFAYNLQSVPLAIIGVSYSVAAFPALSRLWSEQKQTDFVQHILSALRHIIFWSVPVIALIIVLRAQVVRVVLGGGEFDWQDTRLTAAVLAILAISLTAHAIHLLLVRAFYAGGNTRTPLWITLAGSVVSVAAALGGYHLYLASPILEQFLTSLMRIRDVEGGEVIMLAAGYSFGMLVQTFVMALAAKLYLGLWYGNLLKRIAKALTAAVVGGCAAYLALNFIVDGINPETFMGILLQGAVGGVAGLTGTVLAYYGLAATELDEIYRSVRQRFTRNDIISSQDSVL